MNYLSLVNRALQESGVEMDDLTSSNFANPTPVKMYTRFKNWTAQAWRDLQIENNEWEFGTANAVVSIQPRILVTNGNRSVAPPVDSEYVSASGGASFVVVDSELVSGAWASGTAEAVLTISDIDGNGWILLEEYNETTPDTIEGVFQFKFYGRYNPRDLVSDLEEINLKTVKIQDPETGSTTDVVFVPWAQWEKNYELLEESRGQPIFVTETPQGELDFYPRPDKEYTLTFTYTKEATVLEDYDDEPELDSRYHDIIVWRAVQYYANFDKDQGLWVAAKRRYDQYMYLLDRDIGPKASFEPSRFDYCE
jgi:hypothetical protein